MDYKKDNYFSTRHIDSYDNLTITSPEIQAIINSSIKKEYDLDLFKNISINPNRLFIGLWKADTCQLRTQKQKENEKNLRNKAPHSELSKKARKNLTNAAHWLEAQAEWQWVYSKKEDKYFYFKTNFITLCIPSTTGNLITRSEMEQLNEYLADGSIKPYTEVEQKEIASILVARPLFQKILNNWLTIMREKFLLHNYIWKIEAQKNGQLHIHINTDTFIHYSDINTYWNSILRKNGLLKNFENRYGLAEPPTTDVHSIKNSHDAVGYVCKYMTKNPNFAAIYDGNIWGCSMGLKPSKNIKVKLKQKEFKCFGRELLALNIDWKPCVHVNKITFEETKLGTNFFLKHNEWRKIMKEEIRTAFENHIIYLRSNRSWMPKEYYQIEMFAPDKKEILKAADIIAELIEPPELIDKAQLQIDYAF